MMLDVFRTDCISWWSTLTEAILCTRFSKLESLKKLRLVFTRQRLSLVCFICTKMVLYTGKYIVIFSRAVVLNSYRKPFFISLICTFSKNVSKSAAMWNVTIINFAEIWNWTMLCWIVMVTLRSPISECVKTRCLKAELQEHSAVHPITLLLR